VAAPEAASRPAAASAGVFLGTFALISLAMGGLFAVDLFLAGKERAERRSEARHDYQEGLESARLGRRSQAVDRFQAAVAAERSNPVYQRALAGAMLANGKVAEGKAIADERLQQEPTDAAASLLVARALVRQGRPREAVSYYHRAIYGEWDSDPAGNRVRSRFELVELLARLGAQRELLAELLPLQDEAPSDLDTRRRIAHLFLDAGAPTRAIEIFRDILRRHGKDAESYAGLGEAELARGNYRSAQADLSEAVQLAPADSSIAHRLWVAQRVIDLDPTRRGVGVGDQYKRSEELLRLTFQYSGSCLAAAPPGDSSATNRLVSDSALSALRRPLPRASAELRKATDQNLDLAERIWELRQKQCPQLGSPEEEPVALVLERVAQ
jgi:tetratricopeptide (TPR) repeat protein